MLPPCCAWRLQVYTQQPAINRASQSHLDNEGVRALVDGVCHRISANPGALLLSLDTKPMVAQTGTNNHLSASALAVWWQPDCASRVLVTEHVAQL